MSESQAKAVEKWSAHLKNLLPPDQHGEAVKLYAGPIIIAAAISEGLAALAVAVARGK